MENSVHFGPLMFPQRGVIDLPSRQFNDFFRQETEKIELVARPEDADDQTCGFGLS